MEPESHRLDREALLVERRAVSERIDRDVDEAVAAAEDERRAHLDRFIDRMRFEAHVQQLRQERQQPAGGAAPSKTASRLPAPVHVTEDARTSGARTPPPERAALPEVPATPEHEAEPEARAESGAEAEETVERVGAAAGRRRVSAREPGADIEPSAQLTFDLGGHPVPGTDGPAADTSPEASESAG